MNRHAVCAEHDMINLSAHYRCAGVIPPTFRGGRDGMGYHHDYPPNDEPREKENFP